MEGTDLRTKAVKKRPDDVVWKTGSPCAAVLTHQLTGLNSRCLVVFPGTAYGEMLAVRLEAICSQP